MADIKPAAATLKIKVGMVYVPKGTPVGRPEARIGWASALHPGVAVITVPPDYDRTEEREEVVEFIRQGRGAHYLGWMRMSVAAFQKEWTRA